MADDEDSILLRALDRAAGLAMIEEAQRQREEERASRGSGGGGRLRGGMGGVREGSAQVPTLPGAASADVLLGQLDGANLGVENQIARVQSWLRVHPDLLRLLDQGIRGEVAAMERRTNRKNVAFNVIFTLVGAVLGLVLPYVVGNLSFLTTLLGR